MAADAVHSHLCSVVVAVVFSFFFFCSVVAVVFSYFSYFSIAVTFHGSGSIMILFC